VKSQWETACILQYNNFDLVLYSFGRYSDQKKRKLQFSTTPLSLDAHLQRTPHKLYIARNYMSMGYILLIFMMGSE